MMSIFAAVTTGQGAGPIATIQIFGESAESVIRKIFKAADNKPATLKTGKILLGEIADGNEIIDQVTIGCEEPNSFAINCHGNPLIVEMIMKLLRQNGVKLLSAEQLLAKILAGHNTIVIEAELTQPKVKTIEGAKIIANQINAGLNGIAKSWLENTNTMTLKEIADQVKTILQNSKTAKMIIYGCTIAIAGPPNTGKSTLLNCLCGRPKAIVADIKGTTRDWVSAQCRMGELSAELIDTAGLDETLAAGAENTVERQAQQKTIQILETADLVLLVLDNSQAAEQLDGKLLEKIAGKKILTVLNKSDLSAKFDTDKLPSSLRDAVQISAKFGNGIENLAKKIRQILGVADFDLKQAVCITDRQENLLKKLIRTKSKKQAAALITELLNGRADI